MCQWLAATWKVRNLKKRELRNNSPTGPLLYSKTGKSSGQSSELDAKSDTNEIKLMVTDHADGNRLSALYISVPRLFTSNWTELRGFYSGWRMEINITLSRN